MARLPCLVVHGHPHHVTQRGNRREQTFFADEDYALYRHLIGESAEKLERIIADAMWPSEAYPKRVDAMWASEAPLKVIVLCRTMFILSLSLKINMVCAALLRMRIGAILE